MTIDVPGILRRKLNNRVSSVRIQDGGLVLTPYDCPDGETVSVLVRRLGNDRFSVSDLGLAASRLDEAGINITTGTGHSMWRSITADLTSSEDEYEIITTTDEENLGATILDIAWTILRTDMIRLYTDKEGHWLTPTTSAPINPLKKS